MDRSGYQLNNPNIARGTEPVPTVTNTAATTSSLTPTMAQHLPTYLLYAEDAGIPPSDVMHAESIAERSSLHSWEIRPHRHEALFQLFHVDSGTVDILLDGERHDLRGPGVITIMPLAVHGFRWTSDVRGTVFTILESHLRQLLARDDGLRDSLLQTRCARLPAAQRRGVAQTVSVLFGEYAQHAPWRATAVDAAMTQLFVTLARTLPSGQAREPGVGDRSVAHVQRLRTLVDERFRQQPTLGQLADEIGITTTQLNRVCRTVLGHPALAVLHARICLEAQRELAYTTLSIKHIAYKLGFTDAGYFTRFFERETGSTPSAWRADALTRQ
jgi:AraC family transcriptional regulator, transcriptional activator of pobA